MKAPATLLMATAVAAACARAPDRPPCLALANGVPVVESRGPGAWEAQGLSPVFHPLWLAGGLNEGEELALPISLTVSPGGRAAIPDFQLGEVSVIEPDGRWLGPWTRQGPGPGEIQRPVAAAWTADDRLAIYDLGASKIVFIDSTGTGEELPVLGSFASMVEMSGELHWAGVQPNGSALLHERARCEADGVTRCEAMVLRLPPGGSVPDTLLRAWFPMMQPERWAATPVPGWPQPLAAIGPDGDMALGSPDGSYAILLTSSAGAPTLQLCRAAEPFPFTPDEEGRALPADAWALPADRAAWIEAVRTAERPPSPPAYGRLVLGRDRIWVKRERPRVAVEWDAPYGVPGARFDVFTRAGDYLGEVRLPPGARLQAAAGDTIWTFEVGELGETWVGAYALVLERR